MAGTSTARPAASTPLRRRLHLLERAASRSLASTADSSTQNGDNEWVEEEDAEDDELEMGEEHPTLSDNEDSHGEAGDEDEVSTARGGHNDGREVDGDGDGDGDEYEDGFQQHEHEDAYARPWYNPSPSVLVALAPPVGNWLTGGDHLKDLLLLVLLVLYLHQLVEVPWSLYHAARPRRPRLPVAGPRTHRAARAAAALRTTELLLLALCVAAPVLGVVLLRSLASFSRGAANTSSKVDAEAISWFSTSLFALVTAIRPLRELAARIATRTSTLHAIVHAHAAPPPSPSDTDVTALKDQVRRLEATVKALVERDEAVYAYVEDALVPIERGVRRVERRVGKLKSAAKKASVPEASASACNTIFVPAPPKPHAPTSLSLSFITSWFGSLPLPAPAPAPPPISPSGANGKRRALDSIPEEGEAFVFPPDASTSVYPLRSNPAPGLVRQQHIGVDTQKGVADLLRTFFAAGLALALYPLHLMLFPVRRVLGA
ncbi:hypothetical protein C8R45DRAFT_1213359 [Mycena sanguinolenta]|nr:hypothetical protein C8R45DRAFT_1213359 [Mycena sanguinolenta]